MTDIPYFATRVTQPGSNKPLRISDLIVQLAAIQAEHGDMMCYIYNASLRADVPMLALCVKPAGRYLSISSETDTVVYEMCADLLAEIQALREAEQFRIINS